MPISATDLNKAYLAYFGRPADLTGKTYFATLEQADVIKAFDSSAESKALYGNDAAAKVNAIYQNLFNRDAEPEGLVYWTTLINQGRVTAAGAAFAILNGAQGTDATAVQNKLAASDAFVAAMDTTAELVGYSGLDAAASARNWLKGVSADAASLTAAVAGAQAAVDAAVAVGTGEGGAGFQLTNGTDVASANVFTASLVYTPGGDDRINSLQDEDRLTGTGPNTTLNATLGNANDNGGTMITPTLVNMNTINAAFTGSGGTRVGTLDLQDATGVDAVNITRISDGFGATVQNITSAAKNLSVKNSQAASANVDFTFLASAVAGATDSTTLTLSNVNAGRVRVEQNSATPTQGFETINLVSTGADNFVGAAAGLQGLMAEDLQKLVITGKSNLTIGSFTNVAGSFTALDASAFEGNLTVNMLDGANGILNAIPDGKSNGNVAFSLTGGKGNDSVRVFEQVGVTDTIKGGEGTDTIRFNSNGNTSVDFLERSATVKQVSEFEAVQVWRTGTGVGNIALAVRADQIDGDNSIQLLNNTNGNGVTTYNLVNLSAAEATSVSIRHSGNTTATTAPAAAANAVNQNFVDIDVADGVTAAGITIADGVNSDPRFNFTLYTDSDRTLNTTGNTFNYAQGQNIAGSANTFVNTVTSLTLTDNDSESNSVLLTANRHNAANVAQGNGTAYTGTITINGTGAAGNFFNLDSTANLLRKDQTGTQTDGVGVVDVGGGAAERLQASTIDASTYAGDVIVRVSNSIAATGAQTIKMGSGNDFVIFDALNDSRAGLTISDTVTGGDGNDTLVIDGNGVAVTLGASEWTNVSGFETIHLVGNNVGQNNGRGAVNSYNLTLTNDLINANGVDAGGVRRIAIVNDNDPANDTVGTADTAGTGLERGVTIDARGLSANRSFSYNGEEGASRTADRFILADANINGSAVIDGGAVRAGGNASSNAANGDVIEVRNAAVVTIGDLAGVTNVGTLEFTNDTASVQTSILQLDNATVDALVNSTQTASATGIETLTITAIDNPLLPAARTQLNLDASGITSAGGGNGAFLSLNVTAGGGNDTIVGGAGADTIVGGAGVDSIDLGADTAADFVRADEGHGAIAVAGTFTAVDTVTNFITANDTFQVSGAGTSVVLNGAAAAQAAGTAFTAVATGTFDLNGAVGGALITGATAASLTNEAQVIAAIGAIANETAGEEAYFVVANAAGTQVGVYHFVSAAGDNVINAGELELLGVVTHTGAITVADFVFA